ncbi:MAG: hypothetical protein ACOYOU_14390 [Kiritimatiellia bacterium]
MADEAYDGTYNVGGLEFVEDDVLAMDNDMKRPEQAHQDRIVAYLANEASKDLATRCDLSNEAMRELRGGCMILAKLTEFRIVIAEAAADIRQARKERESVKAKT